MEQILYDYAVKIFNKEKGYTLEKAQFLFHKYVPKIIYYMLKLEILRAKEIYYGISLTTTMIESNIMDRYYKLVDLEKYLDKHYSDIDLNLMSKKELSKLYNDMTYATKEFAKIFSSNLTSLSVDYEELPQTIKDQIDTLEENSLWLSQQSANVALLAQKELDKRV